MKQIIKYVVIENPRLHKKNVKEKQDTLISNKMKSIKWNKK